MKKDADKISRGHMHVHAWKVIMELQEKLMEQIDWKTRNLWQDEYREVVLEGVRFLMMAKEQFGDPR
jgi:hypothetical protein